MSYKNDKHFLNRLDAKNTTTVLTKATFNYLQALKKEINDHDDGDQKGIWYLTIITYL